MCFNLIKKQCLLSLINSGIEQNEAIIELNLIIEKITGYSKKDFIINPQLELPQILVDQIEKAVNKRITTKKPVQYILNEANFMGEKFFVDENVLIPRDETEILVNETQNIIKKISHPELVSGSNHHSSKNKEIKILDIGTGSGCIACTIAKLTNQNISAIDISEAAIKVANKNAKNLGLEHKITFIRSDLFNNINNNLKFDIIVSNPPYIPVSERENLQAEVTKHEPHLALFADDDDGIEIYKKIIEQSKQYLNKNGYILFELGINQDKLVSDIFIQNGFNVIKLIKDFGNINRVIAAQII